MFTRLCVSCAAVTQNMFRSCKRPLFIIGSSKSLLLEGVNFCESFCVCVWVSKWLENQPDSNTEIVYPSCTQQWCLCFSDMLLHSLPPAAPHSSLSGGRPALISSISCSASLHDPLLVGWASAVEQLTSENWFLHLPTCRRESVISCPCCVLH